VPPAHLNQWAIRVDGWSKYRPRYLIRQAIVARKLTEQGRRYGVATFSYAINIVRLHKF